MPFNRRTSDNQAAALSNPGVTPARNNRMTPPVPGAVPGSAAPTPTSVTPPLSSVPQATPTSVPNVPGAGMTPAPINTPPSNVPMQPTQLNNLTAATNRNGADGLPPQGPRNPLVRNKRIV